MTDLHTHILPGMDDGAQSVDEAVKMLHMEAEQGIDTVALTPHFYRHSESVTEFLARRDAAWRELSQAVQGETVPSMILGAEVAWMPEISQWPDLERLCYQDTKLLVVELPTAPWAGNVFTQLYGIENRRGIMPVIAHVDRHFRTQSRRNLYKLFATGYPLQVSAEALLKFTTRGKALELLKYCDGLLISDCHNLETRAPKLGAAMAVVEKKLGTRMARDIMAITDDVLED